jgi:hypothetical protein
MRKPDSYEFHRGARILRARAMRIAARRALRSVRYWVVEVLFRPLFDPLYA